MDDFFKQFKDNLDNQPEPHFEEKDWDSLEKRLTDKQEKRPLRHGLLWLLLPLFLMSLAANGVQYYGLKKTNQKMALLESHLDGVKQQTVVIQSDTIYKINTIYERDTFYKTKILYEPKIVYVTTSKDSFDTAFSNHSLLQPKTSIKTIEGNTKAVDDKILNDNTLSQLKTRQPQALILGKSNLSAALNFEPIIRIPRKTMRERLEDLRPTGYNVGVSTGLAYPMSPISSKPSGYAFGLQGAVAFSSSVSLWADVQYMQLSYQADRMNDAIGIPVVAPPSNDFRFNLVKVNQPMLQYMAGLRYRFEGKKRVQPYIGLGFGAVTSLPYEIDYEFKNGGLGTVWEISQKINKQDTRWGYLLFDVGFEKRLSKQYRWQIGANYRLELAPTAPSYRLLGIKTGLLFDF